jgi:hypothetical protein
MSRPAAKALPSWTSATLTCALSPVGKTCTMPKLKSGTTSKYFFDYQLPAPPDVDAAIRKSFE